MNLPLRVIHNEPQLLKQIAGGDRTAFQTLYGAYYESVRKYIVLFEPRQNNLDELTQDVFVRIWEKREKLENVQSFKNYLFLLTRHVVFNYIRALKVHRLRDLEDGGEPVGGNLEDELLFRQYYSLAMEAIEKLPEGRRKVLKMTIDQGLSLDEIAAALHITKAGVKKQLYAATAYVRQYLRDNGEISVLLLVFLSLFE